MTTVHAETETPTASIPDRVDVVVVGAGFAGLYLLHRLRGAGFSAVCFEAADGVGGTWYWNRYPGARCDIQSIDYSYSFDPELDDEWTWSEKYATQPEILRYVNHVADKHDLRRDIVFETRVVSSRWDDDAHRWSVTVSTSGSATSGSATSGDVERVVSCRHLVMATGCLSVPKTPDVPGAEHFTGEVYSTAAWPHDGVAFTGKRVGVIGTGSSGIQSIPLIAQEAEQLTVFQRTPNFSFPAGNGPVPEEKLAAIAADRDAYREEARWSRIGVPTEIVQETADMLDDAEIQRRLEVVWERGELVAIGSAFSDMLTNPDANEIIAEFVRGKIRDIVDDPDVAATLSPTTYPLGTKRPCLDTGYYATFNRPNVELVDLRETPIETVTEHGVRTSETDFAFDALVYATGFDAMTGAIVGVDIRGRDGRPLADKWADGPRTYLGLMSVEFPNLFLVTGPGSPSVLSNMMVSIEQHVDWITDALVRLRDDGHDTIEPTVLAEDSWVRHVNDWSDITLYPQANSWYVGANVPGKPRVFLPYVGGVDRYRQVCDDVVEQDYLGFVRDGADADPAENDGIIRRLQPDVEVMLELLAELGAPALEDLPVDAARMMNDAMATQRPPGPDIGAVVDGEYPGADGEQRYRLYRPDTPGPHPIVLYFHGGGWVLGSEKSDDPFCRYLCVHADAVVVSVDYRHAPEAPFPAAVDDAVAALRWVGGAAADLGGIPGRLAVAGWSAGGNLAAVVAQHARDHDGPALVGQVLVTPVTDSDLGRDSYVRNGEGKLLTTGLMEWFWNHYDPADRTDPRVAPLRAASLADLPPAFIATCEFDPLCDEGAAYAAALRDSGVDVTHVEARGQIHTSIPGVDAIVTADEVRAEIAAALRAMVHG